MRVVRVNVVGTSWLGAPGTRNADVMAGAAAAAAGGRGRQGVGTVDRRRLVSGPARRRHGALPARGTAPHRSGISGSRSGDGPGSVAEARSRAGTERADDHGGTCGPDQG